jgi:hypothetical protein
MVASLKRDSHFWLALVFLNAITYSIYVLRKRRKDSQVKKHISCSIQTQQILPQAVLLSGVTQA